MLSSRGHVSSHSTSIPKIKLFLEKENKRMMERRAGQSSSAHNPTQEAAVTEEMIRNLQQVAEMSPLAPDGPGLTSPLSPGVQERVRAAVVGSERKRSPAAEGGATPAAGELHGGGGQDGHMSHV